MRTDGTSIVATDRWLPPGELLNFIRLPEIHNLEERFATKRGNARGGSSLGYPAGGQGRKLGGTFLGEGGETSLVVL